MLVYQRVYILYTVYTYYFILILWPWVKTLYPEDQNSWHMGVHHPENGGIDPLPYLQTYFHQILIPIAASDVTFFQLNPSFPRWKETFSPAPCLFLIFKPSKTTTSAEHPPSQTGNVPRTGIPMIYSIISLLIWCETNHTPSPIELYHWIYDNSNGICKMTPSHGWWMGWFMTLGRSTSYSLFLYVITFHDMSHYIGIYPYDIPNKSRLIYPHYIPIIYIYIYIVS